MAYKRENADIVIIIPEIVNEIKSDFGVFLLALFVFSDKNMLEPPPENARIPKIIPKKNWFKWKLIL